MQAVLGVPLGARKVRERSMAGACTGNRADWAIGSASQLDRERSSITDLDLWITDCDSPESGLRRRRMWHLGNGDHARRAPGSVAACASENDHGI